MQPIKNLLLFLFLLFLNVSIAQKNIKNSFNYVVNLGGYVDHSNKEKTFKSHYLGCKNLSEVFLKRKIEAFIQMGSSGEYGRSRSPQNENSKCKRVS